jgi:hypothetical protein
MRDLIGPIEGGAHRVTFAELEIQSRHSST